MHEKIKTHEVWRVSRVNIYTPYVNLMVTKDLSSSRTDVIRSTLKMKKDSSSKGFYSVLFLIFFIWSDLNARCTPCTSVKLEEFFVFWKILLHTPCTRLPWEFFNNWQVLDLFMPFMGLLNILYSDAYRCMPCTHSAQFHLSLMSYQLWKSTLPWHSLHNYYAFIAPGFSEDKWLKILENYRFIHSIMKCTHKHIKHISQIIQHYPINS